MDDFDDIDALLGVDPLTTLVKVPKAHKTRHGVVVECGQAPPRQRVLEGWSAPVAKFKFSGYVALVNRCTCSACDNTFDHLVGLFTEEVAIESGARRLQGLAENGDWPVNETHRKEITQVTVRVCGHCIGDLGFSKEVDSKGLPFKWVFEAAPRAATRMGTRDAGEMVAPPTSEEGT